MFSVILIQYKFFIKGGLDMISNCRLCPHMCECDRSRGEIGICGCSDTVRVARAAPHFWEEPCISGSRGSGTVFFSGCNLGCIYCQNRPISDNHLGVDISVKQLADTFLSLQSQNVHNINLVTPTPWVTHIKSALDIAWEEGLWLPVVYNCGGYESVEALRSLSGYIRIYLPDFKYLDSDLSLSLSGTPDYPAAAMSSIEEMVRQTGDPVFDTDGIMLRGVIVRHLILPGHIDNSMRVLEYLHSTYGDSILISIMNQYTPMPEMTGELSRKVSPEEYKAVTDHALSIGITRGFTQDGEAAIESFIPKWDGTGVIS